MKPTAESYWSFSRLSKPLKCVFVQITWLSDHVLSKSLLTFPNVSNRPFSGKKTFSHCRKGTHVNNKRLMTVEFHLAASVSGPWYRRDTLSAVLSRLAEKSHNRAPSVISNTCGFLMWQVKVSAVEKCPLGEWMQCFWLAKMAKLQI